MINWLARFLADMVGRDPDEWADLSPIVEERTVLRGVEVVSRTNVRLLEQVLAARNRPPTKEVHRAT